MTATPSPAPASATPAAQPNPVMVAAAAAFHTLLSEYAVDLISGSSSIIDTAMASLENDPSITNLAAQNASIALTAPLAIPGIESTMIKQTATAVRALLAFIKTQPVSL